MRETWFLQKKKKTSQEVNVRKKVKVAQSCQLFAIPWTIRSMEFSRPEYWSGLPFPSPGNLPNPGIKPASLALKVNVLLSHREVLLKCSWHPLSRVFLSVLPLLFVPCLLHTPCIYTACSITSESKI